MDVTNRTSEVDLTNYVPNGEWELLEARLIRNVVFYSCCPEPFPDLTVTLKIRRKILYYMVNVVLPCMMMSVLTLLVFCLPPESGEKVALGITVLLAFSVFMLAIAEKMPETSESIPLIGKFLPPVGQMRVLIETSARFFRPAAGHLVADPIQRIPQSFRWQSRGNSPGPSSRCAPASFSGQLTAQTKKRVGY